MQWNTTPCGTGPFLEGTLPETRQYFDHIRKNRYEVTDTWIPRTIDFSMAQGKKLLEIGHGVGSDLLTFAENGGLVHGIDITQEHHRLAKLNFEAHGQTGEFKLCEAENIEYPDNHFDYVYSMGVLHHTPHTERCFQEAYRVLKPGGLMVVAVYHTLSAYHVFAKLLYEGILLRRLFKLGYAGLMSTIEYGADGIHIKPLVKTYRRRQIQGLLSDFASVEFRITHFKREHIPLVGHLLPLRFERWLEPLLGWYVVAFARKRESQTPFHSLRDSTEESGCLDQSQSISHPKRSPGDKETNRRLTISWNLAQNYPPLPQTDFLSVTDLRQEVLNGNFFKRILKYDDVTLLTHRLEDASQPLKVCLVSRLLSRGKCDIRDETGNHRSVSVVFLISHLGMFLADTIIRPKRMRQCRQEISTLTQTIGKRAWSRPDLDFTAQPLYLRTNHVFGLCSGGCIGHTAGVLNNLSAHTGDPVFVTTDQIPTVQESIETHLIPGQSRFHEYVELPELFDNLNGVTTAITAMKDRRPSFVYQRYSRFNYAGATLAHRYGVPFVMEYNGSEVWIAQHWSRPLKHRQLGEDIELLNLRAAHLVVVVSQPMKDELIDRGIQQNKILVNPNGVDPTCYSPTIDGLPIRQRYQFNDKIVIGFIGTFGLWHGADALVKAFGELLLKQPQIRHKVHLLLIGDGQRRRIVNETIDEYGIHEHCTLAGSIPQSQGPSHLAACDILASPHVPNPDGTPFFGSPTKLFEYMAMGKAIIASDLNQIGEVLDHDQTAYLVQPGDIDALREGLMVLIANPQQCKRLGQAARRRAVAKHTWHQHTLRIIEALAHRCAQKKITPVSKSSRDTPNESEQVLSGSHFRSDEPSITILADPVPPLPPNSQTAVTNPHDLQN